MSLFAVAFPLAPLLAYVSNLVEARTDFAKLSKSRRPPAVIRYCTACCQLCCCRVVSYIWISICE